MAELLLAKGADPNARDKRQHTPLHWADEDGYIKAVEILSAAANQSSHARRIIERRGGDGPQRTD
jgi:ankyrin repeat protein